MVYNAVMVENIDAQAIGETKQILETSRFIKEMAREENVKLGGSRGKELEAILLRTHATVSELEEDNKGWVTEKRSQLGNYLDDIPEEKLRDSYNVGLERFVQQQFRLIRSVSPDELNKLDDPTYLTDCVKAYTFDYYLSLRTSQRIGVTAPYAVDIAQLSYRYDPDVLKNLMQEFPEFNASDIVRTMIKNNNPEGFLNNAKQQLEQFTIDFPGFSPTELSRAVITHPENTKDFLEGVEKTAKELAAKYKFSPSEIRTVIMAQKDPEGVLKNAEIKAKELYEEYSDIPPSVIRNICIDYKNPKEFFETAKKKTIEIAPQFSNFTEGQILRAVIGNPKNPEKFLEDIEADIPRLTEQFPSLSDWEIRRIAVAYRKPDPVLQRVVQDREILSVKYSDLPAWIVPDVTLDHTDSDLFIQESLARVENLREQFPTASDNIIYVAAFQKPEDPEAYVKDNLSTTAA